MNGGDGLHLRSRLPGRRADAAGSGSLTRRHAGQTHSAPACFSPDCNLRGNQACRWRRHSGWRSARSHWVGALSRCKVPVGQFRGVSKLHADLGEHPAAGRLPTTSANSPKSRSNPNFSGRGGSTHCVLCNTLVFTMQKTAPAIDVAARTPRKVTRETPSIQSLDRGLQILETIGASGSAVSLGHLAAILGIATAAAPPRLANTLKRRGFLTNPSAPGKAITYLARQSGRLSRQYDWSKMLATVAHDRLKFLAATTNETAHLAVREGRKALFIDHAATRHVIAISGQTGRTFRFLFTALLMGRHCLPISMSNRCTLSSATSP